MMDQQIRKLATKAGFRTQIANMNVGQYQDGKRYFYAEDFIEKELSKFAELIVKECALTCIEDVDTARILNRFGIK